MAITLDSIEFKRLAFLGLIEVTTFKRFTEVWARARKEDCSKAIKVGPLAWAVLEKQGLLAFQAPA